MKLGTFGRAALMLASSVAAVAAVAQTVGDDEGVPANPLNSPADPEIFGSTDPSVVKATAIINGEIITATDIDHRLALIVLANGGSGRIPPGEMQRLRAQVLRNLVDETLQIQAAAGADIKVEPAEIDNYFKQYSSNFGRQPEEFAAYLRSQGSSERSIKRQIHGEIAWTRLQRRQIEPFVSVGEEEVQTIIDRPPDGETVVVPNYRRSQVSQLQAGLDAVRTADGQRYNVFTVSRFKAAVTKRLKGMGA